MENLDKLYSKYRKRIDDEIAKVPLPSIITKFRDPLLYPLQGKGKRFRPFLLLMVGESLGKNINKLLPAALAVEILHTFTLVHDDIMDQDKVRRGLPTVHEKWNSGMAILSGDGLFALAYRKLMQLEYPRIKSITIRISETLLKICEGQVRDMNFEQKLDVTPRDYLKMVRLKTGELIGLSCALGAMLAEAEEEIVERLHSFGLILGQAFQIQDDILEISSDQEQMGKSLGSDFVAGKKTYPLTVVLSKLKEEEKKNFMSFLKKNSYNRKDVMNKFEQYNAIKEGEQLVSTLINNALKELEKCPSSTRTRLKYVVDLISNRDH
jgi:geranylgeranyl diphosphate synthase type II